MVVSEWVGRRGARSGDMVAEEREDEGRVRGEGGMWAGWKVEGRSEEGRGRGELDVLPAGGERAG